MRFDHHFAPGRTLFVRYSYGGSNSFTPSVFGPPLGGDAVGGVGLAGTFPSRGQSTAVSFIYLIRPNLINDFRFGLLRNFGELTQENVGKNLSEQFGIPGVNRDRDTSGLAWLSISGLFNLGDSILTPLRVAGVNPSFSDRIRWTFGRQTISTGFDYAKENANVYFLLFPRGFYIFEPLMTGSVADLVTVGNPHGSALASFVAGYPTAVIRDTLPPANRLRMTGGSLLTGHSAPIGKAELAYSYLDPNGAYLLNQKERLTPKAPALYGIRPLIEPALKVYGEDTNDQTWFRHSPLAHLATITCPVSTFWTTADVLVPMNQIGDRWVQPFDAREFPPGVTMDPARLTTSKEGRLRLMDVLPEQAYEVFVVPMPDGAVKRSVSQAADQRKVIELPVSAKKQWSITILDEGPPEPQVDHLKYNLRWTRDGFLRQTVTGRIAPQQLTAAKLERLMDRYAGREWLPTPLKQLDQPESEKADVMRGLRT